jgi:ribonuclease P protein subunit RPR2
VTRRRDKHDERHIAAARVGALLEQARREALGPDADLADRYAALARRVAMRYQVGLGPGRTLVCRKCGVFRVPGRTSRARVSRHRIVTTCLACGEIRRRPLPRGNA